MPPHVRPWLRPLWLLVLCLQLALPALAVVADARVDAASRAAGDHIESLAHACDVGGHPEQCALCQFARSSTATTSGEVPALLGFESQVATGAALATARPSPASRSSLPRGPPLLV